MSILAVPALSCVLAACALRVEELTKGEAAAANLNSSLRLKASLSTSLSIRCLNQISTLASRVTSRCLILKPGVVTSSVIRDLQREGAKATAEIIAHDDPGERCLAAGRIESRRIAEAGPFDP